MDFNDCLGTRSSWKGTASAVPQMKLSQKVLQAPEKASFSRDGLQRLLGNAVLVEGHGFSRAANETVTDSLTSPRKSQLFEGWTSAIAWERGPRGRARLQPCRK